MKRLRKLFSHRQQLLPALLLAVALVFSGTNVADPQPVKGKEGAGFFAQTAVDATSSGFSKSGPVLHVAERFILAVPATVLCLPRTFVVAACSSLDLFPSRSRAPPSSLLRS